jgi:hypothetical protein
MLRVQLHSFVDLQGKTSKPIEAGISEAGPEHVLTGQDRLIYNKLRLQDGVWLR